MHWEEGCPDCREYWITCPCCDVAFCRSCGMTEEDAEIMAMEEEE